MHADHRYERVLSSVISAPTYEGGASVQFPGKKVLRDTWMALDHLCNNSMSFPT